MASVPCVLTAWLGLHFGLVLTHYQSPTYRGCSRHHYRRAIDTNVLNAFRLGAGMRHWAAFSSFCFALGWVISPFWPMNKQIWSPSYLFMTAGACGYLLIALYMLYDYPCEAPAWQRRLRTSLAPARWVGMNTVRPALWPHNPV